MYSRLSALSVRTQTYFQLSLVPPKIIFGGDNRQPEIRLSSQANQLLAYPLYFFDTF